MKHKTLIPVALLMLTAGGAWLGAQRSAAPASQTPVDRPARQAAATFTRTSQVGGRLAPSEQAYAAIDGTHLMQYVNDMTAISRRYRDHGHPQFWGRIIGTDADAENAQWMLDKFTQLGLADVHQQMFDLPPQWMPKSWSVSASGGGKTLDVATAQPTYQAVATPTDGLDVEAVYVGLGSDAELNMAKDLRGKGGAVLQHRSRLAARGRRRQRDSAN
jgi:hypothetical protein